MPLSSVDITQSGRGGSITYREGEHRVPFDWEFAMPPTLVLMWGPKAAGWDAAFPWAAGRQEAIYQFVGEEVVRQKASGSKFRFDLDEGTMDILHGNSNAAQEIRRQTGTGKKSRAAAAPEAHSPAFAAFQESAIPSWGEWPPDGHYDLAALAGLLPGEREEIVAQLAGRDVTWREVEALDRIDTTSAAAALHQALQHHLRIDTRLAAAEALKRRDAAFDLETILARQIRRLNRPAEGLERALALARRHDSPVIRQALLWASYNCTECAPGCARSLLQLSGVPLEPPDPALDGLLTRLGLHNSSNTRSAAFEELSQRVGMVLDYETGD